MTQGYRPPRDPAERFWEKVVDAGDCWLWSGAIDGSGYGSFGVGSRTDSTRRTAKAHRFAYELNRGEIPTGVMIHHVCENRLCVRPDHLEAVTPREHVYKHDSPTSQNGRKTACRHCGRALEWMSGGRRCRHCRNEYMREYKLSRRSD